MESIIGFAIPIMHNQSQWMDIDNNSNSNVNVVSATRSTPGQCNNSDADDYNMDSTLFSNANIYLYI